ncbi:MAG: hypothetical protein H6525_08060 [Actinobacteria bacterium]|nr:hypothetical protein [Actinomycetota bacterium]MCB9412786.1 hypothetical protein [Actinomycetota bacterium]
MHLRRLALVVTAIGLAGCGRLDELTYEPPTTPAQWCEQRPCIEVADTVINEPIGIVLVFALALMWIGSGLYFLATRRGQRSRLWFGIALVLGGVGAGLAGTSYQLFSYVLKCQGRDLCSLTNGYEVAYSVTQAWSVSAMVVAVAFATTSGRARTALVWYAALNAVAYCAVTIVGVSTPSALLLSFPVLMLFALPGVIIVMVISARRLRAPKERAIFTAAVLLILVQVAYYAYWASGLTQTLWDGGNGFYFSENDVLHIGFILWLGYVVWRLGPTLDDRSESR